MVFGRSIDGQTLTFGVSGLLRKSNLIMWDHETESWWQQSEAQAIVGEMAGTRLEVMATQVVSYRDFKKAFPDGRVLRGPRGDFYYNPYDGYDTSSRPFLFRGETDQRLPAMEHIIGIRLGNQRKAYPFTELAKERVVHDTVNGKEIVIFYEPSTRSALDDFQVRNSREVGTASVFVPEVGGRELEFVPMDEGTFRDTQTGTTWNFLGRAIKGPLEGEKLAPVFHMDSLWFSWAATYGDTVIYESSG